MTDKSFKALSSAFNEEFKQKTVGLVTIDEFRKAKETLAKKELEAQEALRRKNEQKKARKAKLAKKKRQTATLSFDVGELEGESPVASAPKSKSKTPAAAPAAAPDSEAGAGASAEAEVPKKKRKKDPTVRTDFLPDREREEQEAALRAKYKLEWIQEQERIKREKLDIDYSFFDGTGHRRAITVPKGTTIGRFLEWVRQDLRKEFSELNAVSAENLLYVKEDLIIPHHVSFYDLIVTKARGKSGPLFCFDAHDDVRLVNDATVQKDVSHPGKIVERHWYETNKHIFPASRWEVYDPTVRRDKYTVLGDIVQKGPGKRG